MFSRFISRRPRSGWISVGIRSRCDKRDFGYVVVTDGLVVAPMLERSYDMFRSLIGTWIPFALIFIASLSARILLVRA